MLKMWYRRWIGNYIFRKLNLFISLSLLVLFLVLGWITYFSIYQLLNEREQAHLQLQVRYYGNQMEAMLFQFKQQVIDLYVPSLNDQDQIRFPYENFVKPKVTRDNKGQMDLIEESFFRQKLNFLINQHPFAQEIVFFRLSDGSIKRLSRTPQHSIPISFDFSAFFAPLPKDYHYPYMGTIPSDSSAEPSLIYVVNPIFDLRTIHPAMPIGYIMYAINSSFLLDLFYKEVGTESGLTITHNNNTLINSGKHNIQSSLMTGETMLSDYKLKITGYKSRSVFENQLNWIWNITFGLFVFFWLIGLFFVSKIQTQLKRRFYQLVYQFRKFQKNPYMMQGEVTGNDEISFLMERFYDMTAQVQDHIRKLYVAEHEKNKAEYQALKMQINPHFLYNSLESLRMHAMVNKQSVLSEKIYVLGELFRWILKSEDELVSLEEEIRFIEYYLELYMVGKADPVELIVQTSLNLKPLKLLKFTLQPIIENAMTHGELEKTEQPQIVLAISACSTDGWLQMTISHNGKGIGERDMQRLNASIRSEARSTIDNNRHVGLTNIHARLTTYFGKEAGLEIIPPDQGKGFAVRLKWPDGKGG